MKNKENLDLRSADLRPPFPSPSLRRAFPLMVRESILLSELGGHSFQPYSNREWVWFEHRLKHYLKGPSYAMRSIQNLETSGQKEGAFLCCTEKKVR